VRVGEDCFVVLSGERAGKARCKCLAQLAGVVVAVVVTRIDRVLVRFLQQSGGGVTFAVNVDAIPDGPGSAAGGEEGFVGEFTAGVADGVVFGGALGEADPGGDGAGGEIAAVEAVEGCDVEVADSGDVAGEEMRDGLAEEGFAERLGSALAEGDAAQNEGAIVAEEGVVLGLVGKHGGVTAFEFELDLGREQLGDFGDDAALIGLCPAIGDGEVDAVGIGFEEGDAAGGEFAAHEIEGLATAAGDFIGGVDVGEAGEAASGEVAVGGIHHELHRRGHGFVAVAFGGGVRRGARGGFGSEAEFDKAVDQGEHCAQMVARGADTEGAHERGIEAGDIGLNDTVGDAGGE